MVRAPRFGLHLFAIGISLVLLNLLLAACSPATPTQSIPQISKGKLKDIFPELAKLPESNSITITYSWDGLSNLAPIGFNYILDRQVKQFEGKGSFSMAGAARVSEPLPRRSKVVTIAIPLDDANNFLQMLANTPVEEGPYRGTPLPWHTDDYPRLGIAVVTPKGLLQFTSGSQLEDYFPWTISYADKEYTSTDATPYNAFSKLDAAYLKKDAALESLKTEVLNAEATSIASTKTPAVTPPTTK